MVGQREVLVVLAGILLVHCDDPQVRIQQGLLRGKYIPAIEGNGTILAFLGIPYAAPPIGDLRFKAPLHAHSWNGVRDATRIGAVCAQKNHLFHVKRGEEDCLFLNVYSPKLLTKDDPLRPVMVWIHGGGFYFGSSSINIYGPEYLVHHAVVLVTLNYRVGPFGFLTLENSEVPGNAGLKDQVMALKWVQQNIEIFGGDPNNVTIFGQSAGGASVQYHMLSPMSKGLFHRAISQSGSTLHPWAFREPSKDYAFRVGKQLGLETNDSHELHKFLCKVPALSVAEAATKVLTPEEKPMEFEYAFLPTIDDKAEEVFLPSHPAKLLSQGQFHQVPYITGVNSQEGILALTKITENSEMFKRLDSEFERVIPSDFPVTRNSSRSEEVVAKIKEFYFQGQPLSKKTMLPFVNMVTDIWFHKDSAIAAEKIASHSSSPVYYYNFAFDGPFGILKKILSEKDIPGAAHADELGYLFTNFFNGRADLNSNKPHVVTLKRMVTMWTNFAHTGNPTPIADPLLNVTWISFTPQDSAYLNINNELSIEHGIDAERLQFWKQMYKMYAKL